VSVEGLDALLGTNVPQLGRCVAGTGYEDVPVVGRYGDAHDVTIVVAEFGGLGARLEVPKDAGHVSRASYDLLVSEESAAGEVTSVRAQFSTDSDWKIFGVQVVN